MGADIRCITYTKESASEDTRHLHRVNAVLRDERARFYGDIAPRFYGDMAQTVAF